MKMDRVHRPRLFSTYVTWGDATRSMHTDSTGNGDLHCSHPRWNRVKLLKIECQCTHSVRVTSTTICFSIARSCGGGHGGAFTNDHRIELKHSAHCLHSRHHRPRYNMKAAIFFFSFYMVSNMGIESEV